MIRSKENKRYHIWAAVYALFFGVAMVFGAQLEKKGSVSYGAAKTWGVVAIVIIASFVIVRILFGLLDRYEAHHAMKKTAGKCSLTAGKEIFIKAGLFVLCWLPVFLAVYPGFFLYDAETELNMALTAQYTTHHPLAHVLLLGWTIKVIHKITGSYNAGIAVYIICQSVFVAISFSYILYRLKKWGTAAWIRVVSTLYFCAFPVIAMYALCSTKDVLYCAFLLLFLVELIDYYREIKEIGHGGKNAIRLILTGAGMLLFRNNGLYALIVTIPFLITLSGKFWKKTCLYMLVILGTFIICSFALKTVTRADDSEKQEILTIPIQQLARVYNYENQSLSRWQKDTLLKYLPEEALYKYRPTLSDPVKYYFNSEAYAEDSGTFWKLWAQMGMEHPAAYLNAFLVNNYGFWYPYASLNCYAGNQVYTFQYKDSSYFGYETEHPGERRSLIPAIDEGIRNISLEISWQKIPGLRVLFHPAYYFWGFMLGLCYNIARKRYYLCAVAMLMMFTYLTVLFGPAVLVRYVLYFYFGFPLLLVFIFEGGRGEQIIKKEEL